jgi:hypothetical protein
LPRGSDHDSACAIVPIVAVVVVIIVAVVALIALRFDADAYRPLLVDTVARATGHALEIDGELGLDLFPVAGSRSGPCVSKIRRTSPQGPSCDSLGSEHRIYCFTRREIVIDVAARRVEVGLVRLADGRVNWGRAGQRCGIRLRTPHPR